MADKHSLLANKPKLAAGAVALLAIACTAHLGNGLYQDVATARSEPVLSSTDESRLSASSRSQTASIDTLVAGHWFGSGKTSGTQPQITQQENVPETRLSLELHGVIGSTIAEEGRALIAEKGKSAKYYGVDDELPGGATISSVGTEQVILSRNGMLETLSFPKPQTRAGSNRVATRNNPTHLPAPENTQALSQQQPSQEQRTASLKERLKQLREARDL
ncbi:type II secretion system protein N [Pseudomaricurvus sp.]|uniref:type II secretion system protein N n=1 Tax=Pseudomaricurvus sp. TaxID=2004510 RepID=UPI003F6A7D1B